MSPQRLKIYIYMTISIFVIFNPKEDIAKFIPPSPRILPSILVHFFFLSNFSLNLYDSYSLVHLKWRWMGLGRMLRDGRIVFLLLKYYEEY